MHMPDSVSRVLKVGYNYFPLLLDEALDTAVALAPLWPEQVLPP